MSDELTVQPGTPSGNRTLPPDLQDQHDVLAAGAAAILPAEGLAERLLAARDQGRPLRVKLGIDPSGSELTLGHAVVLRKLRQFQDFGHTAVLVVGGFTGQVGDPSGRTDTRRAQTAEQVVANAAGYFDQVLQILDRDRVEIVNNASWLEPLTLAGLLQYTRMVTVSQFLERDDFAQRFADGRPITLSEFFYPLLQGIDSVEITADVELGGTDQTFNNLVGRQLQRARGQDPQAVLTVPLLVGTDGVQKMGKSLDNYVAISDAPGEQFGKLMSVPDDVVGQYAVLCASLPPADVARVETDVAAGGAPANRAKRFVARSIVALYHGDAAATAAEERFDAVHKRHEVPTDVPEFSLSGTEDPVHIPALLVAAGLASSASDARRKIDAGSVRVDGVPVAAREYDRARDGVVASVVSVGRRSAVRVVAAAGS